MKVLFVRSIDNDADIFTKNVSEELFNKHVNKNVEDLNEQEEVGYVVISEEGLNEDDFIILD